MLPNMKLQLQPQNIPYHWQDLEGQWADQDNCGVTAQIPLGANKATSLRHAVKDSTGVLLQVDQARLMKSKITGKCIIFGSCNRHASHSTNRNTWIRNNQFQEGESQSPDEEVLISIMGSISLDDVDQVKANPSKD